VLEWFYTGVLVLVFVTVAALCSYAAYRLLKA
jgi:hypothetical protein